MLQGVVTDRRQGTREGVLGRGKVTVEPEGFIGGRQAEKPAAGGLPGREQQVQQIRDGGGDQECRESARSPGGWGGGLRLRRSRQRAGSPRALSCKELGFIQGDSDGC